MAQLEHMETIETRLWEAADTLRANSSYASNEYFLPVMGLIFLRHAYSRFLRVKDEIEPTLPSRGGKPRDLRKEDFSQKNAIFLQPEAQFDYLVSLPDSEDRIKAVIHAMELIESDYSSLQGVLPKNEYQELDNDVMGNLLRILNPDVLKKVSGDVFGRIYEYFLARFADLKAHDGGEFFTPISIVSFIAHILDPQKGVILDPACGSGGMFVQSAHIVEKQGANPIEKLTFRGLEKNSTTIRLAKMNLAVHGLEGDIQKAITYYEDPLNLLGNADFVMANPPFNVDEIDAEKIENDPRLVFGLPGVNKEGKVSNGNYIWISYFYSYLNEKGRAGFVMSSQASSAGKGEATVRKNIVETGHVAIMVSISTNFFYTRSVPCELWFFDKGKPEAMKDKILMLDARTIFRQVTRKIRDFSPEQMKNLLSIISLYRGESNSYLEQIAEYCSQTIEKAALSFKDINESNEELAPLDMYRASIDSLNQLIDPFMETVKDNENFATLRTEYRNTLSSLEDTIASFKETLAGEKKLIAKQKTSNNELLETVHRLEPFAETSRSLVKSADLVYRLASKLIDQCEKELNAKENTLWTSKEITKILKTADSDRNTAVERLKDVRYFWKQAQWLTARFPDGKLTDVEGLVKLVDRKEIEANDWSLTPGRYVGVAPEEEDEDFDFEEAMRTIHAELADLNNEAVELAEVIQKNFRELGI